ncbi:MAG: MltA domain-containing protein [Pseudomonadota bacterium]
MRTRRSRLDRRGLLAGASATVAMIGPGLGTEIGVAGEADEPWAALPSWSGPAFDAVKRACPWAIAPATKAEFERLFVPKPLDTEVHLTAYFEPVIPASRTETEAYPTPVLGMPDSPDALTADRAAIERGALQGRAPILFWLSDPIALFFVQVQGSARLEFADGSTARIGYAGRNDHPYVSIGQILTREAGIEDLDAETLRSWLLTDPERAKGLMARNPSYVFFREIDDLNDGAGPIGAWGRPLPEGHAVAVDPNHHDYGDLLWIERADTGEARLWIAMDTGAAIRGRSRFDLFLGTGRAARFAASDVNATGRAWRLTHRHGGRA